MTDTITVPLQQQVQYLPNSDLKAAKAHRGGTATKMMFSDHNSTQHSPSL